MLRALVLPVVFAAAGALAGEPADGLAVGAAAPQFMLPVINDFTPPRVATGPLAPKGVKWGPGKWTGERPDEAKKLVVMSFFATYCEPCKKEMPELARLYEAYKDQGLGVMLVSIDKPEKPEDADKKRDEIVALARDNGVRFPVMHDRFQVVARRYFAERLPYMLMLDPAGNVKVVHVGYTDELKAGLENEIRQLLGLAPLPSPADATTPASSTTPPPAGRTKGARGKG
jgi:thiol-disulfide isomerase/thioredoxin